MGNTETEREWGIGRGDEREWGIGRQSDEREWGIGRQRMREDGE